MKKNEIPLIKRVLRGDSTAFAELVETYQKLVYSVCLEFMKNEADALDMAQEVFIKIYNNLDKFNKGCLLSTWVYRISTNTCLNQLKKQRRLNEVQIFSDERFDMYMSMDEMLELQEIKELIEDELEKMDVITQNVMKMRLFGQVKFENIAAVLGIPGSTARTYFTRGRRSLRERVGRFMKESD